ncbi:hypothetical protein U1Q18_034848, partial [Sarracenia purpurea var. burkii]
ILKKKIFFLEESIVKLQLESSEIAYAIEVEEIERPRPRRNLANAPSSSNIGAQKLDEEIESSSDSVPSEPDDKVDDPDYVPPKNQAKKMNEGNISDIGNVETEPSAKGVVEANKEIVCCSCSFNCYSTSRCECRNINRKCNSQCSCNPYKCTNKDTM